MTALIVCHFVLAAFARPLVRGLGRRAFVVLALPPAAATVWAATQWNTAASGSAVTWTWRWMPAYDVTVVLRFDALAELMVLLAAGIGTLVLLYCASYFTDGTPQLAGFAGNLLAFAGAMLALVLADDLISLYVFWELTTVFSFLLIGYDSEQKHSRRSALQALTVTTLGGLAMLVGFLIIGQSAGTYRISAILADPPRAGLAVSVAVVLILCGALSKSAIWPFSLWLPNAMAAPTPVSAYLHAAAMVKAGVYLVARLAPGFADVPVWRPVVIVLGAATMLLGGWRALRLNDLKLVLAYGTVSQLGFLTLLAGTGNRDTALAAAVMILGHALFKAPLFLVTGIVDHAAGTRDLRRLSGVGRALPHVCTVAVLAAASMAALPPLLGFAAKEAAFDALLHGSTADRWALGITVAGSALTVAYTLRFVWGAFFRKPGAEDTPVHRVGWAFLAPPALLAVCGLVLGPGVGWTDRLFGAYADAFPPSAHPYHLALWHGFGTALLLSAVATAGGVLLFTGRTTVTRLSRRIAWPTADSVFGHLLLGLERFSLQLTGFVQRGSLSVYLATTLLVMLAGQLTVLGVDRPWRGAVAPRVWDVPLQGAVALLTCAAALCCLTVRRRMKAVVLAGLTGYGAALLFVVQGGPDLALTQFCVETVSMIVFVLVLRRMPVHFQESVSTWRRAVRIPVALAAAATLGVVVWVASAARTGAPAGAAMVEEVSHHGLKDVVATILVDLRSWDTMGESAVLAAAAVGVTSLIYLHRRTEGSSLREEVRGRTAWSLTAPGMTGLPHGDEGAPERGWLAAGSTLAPEHRSIVFEVVARLLFHPVLVLSVYLLFCAENMPGGGFVAGLVAGLALITRYLAGGRFELAEAAPLQPGLFTGLGLFLSTGVALLGLADGTVLHAWTHHGRLPLIGEYHIGTPVIFDFGVYLLVLGVVLDIVRALGAKIDRQIERAAAEHAAAAGTAAPPRPAPGTEGTPG
ncbi:Na+/H+ antiporter subunit A [Streptomyces sp. NBC_00257]|uniref:Na+/H+ antiporter subunit A n=1 Tax=unclassified Streptomyces TaxID=2593676 RepID=UPI00225A5628|nr:MULTISPECIES: Na+/H+ antiporter subunit A [unclassified Streptomyces]WTB57426.1 Na+/H+ antiporter subunit A [Streptomyces sp. NBC_00826]WTH89692.1 Na+/H+ antiporter subunit A [Streptomyces sp. NBC_00825]WTH98419.1 Na+/H+ antiporter subunit A [Streptomyces sp. NBC_00822]MCX4863788.1 Na+/H+ antiporter subunit A [Streptomyces sp. NBC_00906]MCX4895026.1 Na+/H+ antiporter subunit A [Streptomyces sp. NBC_00892]